MVELNELESYCNELLNPAAFDDYCPNGLQLDAGVAEIRRVVSGVTACQALLERAVDRGADLLLVHHGYFWKGETQPLVGMKGRRVRTLIQNGINLMAYHLPLDAHPGLGNNHQLAQRFGIEGAAPLDEKEGLLWCGILAQAESPAEFAQRIARSLDRPPLHIAGGDHPVRRVGWCSGGGEGYLVQAAAAGLDAFVSGEVSEQTTHQARELGIHYFAAGHHATERYGVQRLGETLAQQFGLWHEFIDIPNPV